jgi:hypothetical protein
MNLATNLAQLYPGVYNPDSHTDNEGAAAQKLPTKPLNTLLGFDLETYQIPLDQLLPSKKVPDGIMSTRKYKQIVSSIHEIGLIEPLAVIQPDASKSEYILLDGHLRVLAFKELGLNEVACLFAKDDETHSYVAVKFMYLQHRHRADQARNTCTVPHIIIRPTTPA